jgi:hypothetical protein
MLLYPLIELESTFGSVKYGLKITKILFFLSENIITDEILRIGKSGGESEEKRLIKK